MEKPELLLSTLFILCLSASTVSADAELISKSVASQAGAPAAEPVETHAADPKYPAAYFTPSVIHPAKTQAAAPAPEVKQPGAEEAQQEEQFSEPVQELTDKARAIPVYSHIYGADFISEQERCEYLLKLDSARDKAERDRIRTEHRKYIDMRKKERGG
jgi:uncharacterized membrane protein